MKPTSDSEEMYRYLTRHQIVCSHLGCRQLAVMEIHAIGRPDITSRYSCAEHRIINTIMIKEEQGKNKWPLKEYHCPSCMPELHLAELKSGESWLTKIVSIPKKVCTAVKSLLASPPSANEKT